MARPTLPEKGQVERDHMADLKKKEIEELGPLPELPDDYEFNKPLPA